MRYALILAGGSGVRLWPMSRRSLPKQLIPFLDGKSLLEASVERLAGLVPDSHQYICAGEAHRDLILQTLPSWSRDRFLGEPMGRDTLNAIGLATAVIARRDPEAIVAVFTADHLIQPVDRFQQIVARGYALVEQRPNALVTFGIEPSGPSTSYGYLELAEEIAPGARRVRQFREKPGSGLAGQYFQAGPESYLWNSGMFVWKASTLLDCIRRYEPEIFSSLSGLAEHWGKESLAGLLDRTYPALKKISIDYAVMEPASGDGQVMVAAIPMPLFWMDVGSWPAYGDTCRRDEAGNALAAEKTVLRDAAHNLIVSSRPHHLIAVMGCENLTVVHTADATLICRSNRSEDLKALCADIAGRFGEEYL